MATYTINQPGAGNYEWDADSPEQAIQEMAEGIVENCENWQLQYNTDDFEEAVEEEAASLRIVDDEDAE